MPIHTVGPGDSIPSIAHENGFLTSTIWDHPRNAQLKARRKDPNVLFPGDEVFIPEKELKEVEKSTNSKHVFKLRGEPYKIRLRLLRLGKPRANEPYVLAIDGTLFKGTTDSNGILEHVIPRNAKSGMLTLSGGKERMPVHVGRLDPIDELQGIQQRLNNLGFDCGAADGELNDLTRAALAQFQAKYQLEPTGEPDAATKAKLDEVHG